LTNKDQYKILCSQATDLPLFLQHWWLDAVCEHWDVAIAKNGDHTSGVWPYPQEQKIGTTLLRNPALTPYLGPHVFYPHDLKITKRDNFEHETIAALLAQVPEAKVWHLSMPPGQKQLGLLRAAYFDVQPRQTFLMHLDEDAPAIFLRLHEDYRRNIRKAEDEMEVTDDGNMLQQLWQYQEATLSRKDVQMHFSPEQLQQLYNACKENNSCALWVARKEGVVQAILWHVWDNERAYYLVGSKNPEVKDNRAMTLLIWKAISESVKMGKRVFDFEGSMDPGVEKFFRNFGGSRELYLVLKKNESFLWKLKELIR
jgi:hypothetical protein